ncbi:tetratricopeptide (TPR) repeat protein [Bartonella doshiae]|nr:tetratricopeptide (TPR) repeat protein [Bartonella doshiae]
MLWLSGSCLLALCFLSPVYGQDSPLYGQDAPSLPFEPPPPQLLLPLDDLIPNKIPSAPATPDSDSPVMTLEDFNSTLSPHTQTAKQRKEAEIARLLKELKYCAQAEEAKKISQQIQRLWAQSGSETIDLLMSWVEDAINTEDYGLALDYIDNVLALSFDYAEAWVRRAWVHIQMSDFKLAMLDLNQAIKFEPRNYIAFFELGVIMEAVERPQLAIKAYEMALQYYPQMQKVQKRVEFLLDQQTSQAL